MKNQNMGVGKPDKKVAAVCGLFCPSCSIYIGTKEDPERLKSLADSFNAPIEEMKCEGCRSDRRIGYCENCSMWKCAAAKGIDFCGACEEFPCEELKAFQAILPHRIELWKSQQRIREAGYEKWYAEMVEHYGCPACGAINSAYDMACRKCGISPGCSYVRLNRREIDERLSRMGEAIETRNP